jgi:peptidoglycan/LPS O-acetylase OafA/YrhL/cellulose synthase/poly-beta-1,6-N-acetylglucosamine synthase-like glycosyltransferase
VSTPTLSTRVRLRNPLPLPPTDDEKYWYMGRQHRWLLFAQAASFSLIAYSIFRFATADTRLLLFLLPMSLYGITLGISLASSGRRKRTSGIDHEFRVMNWHPDFYPSVDVFLPSAGEPLDLLANTYAHVAQLDWGLLNIYVLDDSARPEVHDLATQYGFHYLTRPNRGHLKKAGNLRFGYEHSRGDFILILDADFVPRLDALWEMLPYFEEQNVGIVQTPQFFDTHTGLRWLQRCAGATQELFYRWIQPSRDRSDAAICVGTCALYRRSALQESGGFAQIGHSEDVHTGVNLMKVGYLVRYVPIIVSKGLCPDTISGFLNQQYRWCTGSMSLLADKSFHAAKHISFRQRLCFWSGFLYYISTGLNAFVAPLPALAMLYFLPRWIEPMNSIWLVGVLCLWFIILPSVMKSRWRVDVLRVQILYSFAHAVAIIHILSGRTKEWVATGAANTRTTPLAVTIGRVAKIYVALTYSLLWFGLIRGALTYGFDRFWAMIALAVLATYIHLPIVFISTRVRATNTPVPTRVMPPTQRNPLIDTQAIPSPADTQPVAVVVPPRDMTPEAAGVRRFRPDIQGLRAIAVMLVVLYHAGVPGITGGYVGVDVFFVISGFLITGQLLREVQRTGRISFTHFYANRMRRLLPPAALVLVLTVIVARTFGSLFQFRSIATDAIYTAGYLFNYRLAAEGVDYQNANGPESPLQHFWSLAVEEQFYFIWPLLLMICVWLAKRHAVKAVTAVLLATVAVSLYFSITVTSSNAPLAYFSIHTRAWELGLGALVALAAERLSRQPRAVAMAASWIGVGGIIATGLLYTDDTAFPGSAAIVPVVATGLVIAGGCRYTKYSAELVLDTKPMQGMGAVSYSWYLWHWPILILAPFMFGHSFEWTGNIQLMVIALWIATLSYWVVESPTRRSQLKKLLWTSLGLGMSAAVAALALVLVALMPPLIGQGAATAAVSLSGDALANVQKAVGLGTQTTTVPRNLTPTLDGARSDQPVSSKNGCHLDYPKSDVPSVLSTCLYGDRTAKAKRTAVLLGDSHAQQWLPALDKAARDQHWKLYSWTKAACPFAGVQVYNSILKREFSECDAFRDKIIDKIKLTAPDVVIISQSNTVPGNGVTNPQWAEETAKSIGRLQTARIPVVYVGDTPYHQTNVPECVARNLSDVGSCTLKRQYASPYKGRSELLQQTLTATNVTYLDPTDWFCTAKDCPAIVGNLLVYRDESHISTAYSYYLAPLFSAFFPSKG